MHPLRDYQERAVREALGYTAPTCVVLATGGGKTRVAMALLSELPGPGLFIIHRRELLIQADAVLREHGLRDNVEPVTVQGLLASGRRPEASTVIFDECFPAGTLIDDVPIERVRVGDLVRCYNHQLGEVVKRAVTTVFRSPVSRLIKVHTTAGALVCTENHPVFVIGAGYTGARNLRIGESLVHGTIEMRNLRKRFHAYPPQSIGCDVLQPRMHSKNARSTQNQSPVLHLRDDFCTAYRDSTSPIQAWSPVLFDSMSRQGMVCEKFGYDASDQLQIRIEANERTKSDAATGVFRENEKYPARNRAQASGAGRQWTHNAGSSSQALRSPSDGYSRLEYGARSLIGEPSTRRDPNKLQGRYCSSGTDDSDRSGWCESRIADQTGAGSSQDGVSPTARVVGIEILEPGSDGRFGGLCPDRSVYNLEVAEHHNYFANGFLVHNCHHYAADEWSSIHSHYSHARIFGLTATPERSDGQPLGDIFKHLVVAAHYSELLKNGHLVPCRVIRPDERLDRGLAQDPVTAYLEHCESGSGFVFAPRIEEAEKLAARFTEAGVPAGCVSEETPTAERDAAIGKLKSGELKLLSSVFALTEGVDVPSASVCILARNFGHISPFLQACLDEKTEILTRRGWQGIDDLVSIDEVAAVDLTESTPTTRWEIPSTIIKRQIDPSEFMVEIRTPRQDIRVTSTHDIFHRHRIAMGTKDSSWGKSSAEDRMKAPGNYEIPSAAIQDAPGVPLSDAELRVIGWYMTDGYINKKNNVLCISQAEGQPFVDEIHKCLKECGFRYGVNRLIPRNAFPNARPRLTFSVTYNRPLFRADRHLRGYIHLAKYMSKDLAPSLEEMTSDQLSVLLEAMHWGNGAKQATTGQSWTRKSYHIYTRWKTQADRIQSLCVRRGWSCNVAIDLRPGRVPLFCIHAKRGIGRHIGGSTSEKPHLIRSEFTPTERVWCVTVSTGAIITRRNYKSVILGNCGRILRPFPGKAHGILLDLPGLTWCYGSPTDDRTYALTGAGISRTTDPITQCLNCGFSYESGSSEACPNCGFIAPSPKWKPLKIYSVELREAYAGKATDEDVKRNEYLRLRKLALTRGWSIEFVVKEYRKLFGQAPILFDVTEEEKRAQYYRFLAIAKERGYKSGFAAVRFKTLFNGQWPSRQWSVRA